jgi:FecR protein
MATHRGSWSGLIGILLALAGGAAVADGAGQVVHLSGTLSAQRPDGTIRILSRGSEINQGDTLTTQADSYGQLGFSDGSSMTMRPHTQMRIEAYQFDKEKPDADNAFFRLLKGGLRTATGLVGKRGNLNAYKIGTPVATIGIRGSTGDTLDCTQGCDGVTSTSGKAERGLYHATYTGSYVMENESGEVIVGEARFGFVRDRKTKPVLLPGDPGLNLDELPFAISRPNPGGKCDVVR